MAGASDGFSLIEALAAIAVLAIALATLLPALGAALRVSRVAEGHLAARLQAQSLIEEQTMARVLSPGATHGGSGDMRWTIVVEPADETLARDSGPGDWRLYRIEVVVEWPRQRRFALSTLHLARSP